MYAVTWEENEERYKILLLILPLCLQLYYLIIFSTKFIQGNEYKNQSSILAKILLLKE